MLGDRVLLGLLGAGCLGAPGGGVFALGDWSRGGIFCAKAPIGLKRMFECAMMVLDQNEYGIIGSISEICAESTQFFCMYLGHILQIIRF